MEQITRIHEDDPFPFAPQLLDECGPLGQTAK
jgi:hypothetical protein